MGPTGPYFYLPKMESHLEARLWNDIFCEAQDMLNIPRGTIKVGSCVFVAMKLDPDQHVLHIPVGLCSLNRNWHAQPLRTQHLPRLMIPCSPPASLKR